MWKNIFSQIDANQEVRICVREFVPGLVNLAIQGTPQKKKTLSSFCHRSRVSCAALL